MKGDGTSPGYDYISLFHSPWLTLKRHIKGRPLWPSFMQSIFAILPIKKLVKLFSLFLDPDPKCSKAQMAIQGMESFHVATSSWLHLEEDRREKTGYNANTRDHSITLKARISTSPSHSSYLYFHSIPQKRHISRSPSFPLILDTRQKRLPPPLLRYKRGWGSRHQTNLPSQVLTLTTTTRSRKKPPDTLDIFQRSQKRERETKNREFWPPYNRHSREKYREKRGEGIFQTSKICLSTWASIEIAENYRIFRHRSSATSSDT